MHCVFAPQPLAELGARLARAVRVFLLVLLAAGTIAAGVVLALDALRIDHVIAGWGLLAGFSLAGIRAYRSPGS